VAESRPLADLLRDAVAADAALCGALGPQDIDTLFDPQVAAGPAALRCDEMLQRLRPQAAALAAARPWRSALPPDTTTTEVLA
jgi:3-carboxy-cis,cis-muconate cycloisomerase